MSSIPITRDEAKWYLWQLLYSSRPLGVRKALGMPKFVKVAGLTLKVGDRVQYFDVKGTVTGFGPLPNKVRKLHGDSVRNVYINIKGIDHSFIIHDDDDVTVEVDEVNLDVTQQLQYKPADIVEELAGNPATLVVLDDLG